MIEKLIVTRQVREIRAAIEQPRNPAAVATTRAHVPVQPVVSPLISTEEFIAPFTGKQHLYAVLARYLADVIHGNSVQIIEREIAVIDGLNERFTKSLAIQMVINNVNSKVLGYGARVALFAQFGIVAQA